MIRTKNIAYAAIAALPNPSLPLNGQAVTLSEIQDRIQQIAQFLIVVGLVVAVIFIIYGALKYMAARGDEAAAKDARTHIYNGLIGAGVILAIGVLLQTVAGLVTRSFFS